MADEATGFLSRWSRRKALAQQGPLAPEALLVPEPATVPVAAPVAAGLAQGEPAVEAPDPLPTLADVAALTPQSDFTRFVARRVGNDVRNAALRKLFADPHFNVMDGLDTYIDDYNKPDPLPPGMLQQLRQSHFLGLFPEAPVQPPPDPDENSDLRLQPDDAAGCAGPATSPGVDAGCEPGGPGAAA